jgi:F0F1-type ATP synthase assembly protein I
MIISESFHFEPLKEIMLLLLGLCLGTTLHRFSGSELCHALSL